MARILFVDGEADLMHGTIGSLKHDGHELDIAKTGADALKKLRLGFKSYDLVILDLMMPQGNAKRRDDRIPLKTECERVGGVILKIIAERYTDLPVVVCTAIRSNLEGLKPLPKHCVLLTKPIQLAGLLNEVDGIMAEKMKR